MLHAINDDAAAINENLPVFNYNNLMLSQLPEDDQNREEVQKLKQMHNVNNGTVLVKFTD